MQSFWNSFITWLSLKDAFSLTPPFVWAAQWYFVGFLGLCLLIGIAVYFLPIHPSLKGRVASVAWFNVVLGPFLFFFRYQRIPLLGMNIWIVLEIIATIAWIGLIIYYARTSLRKQLFSEQAEAYQKKYLPKVKN